MNTESTQPTELEVSGMTCTNCALSIQKLLEKQGGQEVNVNFATNEVRFINAQDIALDKIINDIESLGYQVIKSDNKEEPVKVQSTLETKLLISALFTFPLLLHMFLPFAVLHNPYLQLILSLPVVYIGIFHFGKSAFNSLKTGIANMDVLITIGAGSAFIYSLVGVILFRGTLKVHDFLFFETAATIITLVLLGNWIEEKAVAKTTSALHSLKKLSQYKAKRVIKKNGKEHLEEVNANSLQVGDEIQANNGDQIMADGAVISGYANVDEALLTGESTPVFKTMASPLFAGSLVVDGSLRYRVEKAEKQSTLAQIIDLVKDAQAKKPGIQKLGDQVSAIFVPTVVLIALATFIVSFFVFDIKAQNALLASIAVLVISCPCAMGLATPTAVMVGVGKGAKMGILLKGGLSTEKLAKIKTIVLDKTGTLTSGDFVITDFQTFHFDENVAKNIVLHLEKHSSHPIARSIVSKYANWSMLPFQYPEIEEVKGCGIKAKDASGNEFYLGKRGWVPGSNQLEQNYDNYLSYEGRVVAAFNLYDQLKPDAVEAIKQLRNMKLEVIMLSGDNEQKCAFAARQLGISTYYHSMLPAQKLDKIRALNVQKPTAMVGDGINDAPALSNAFLGISLGEATNIAQQSADVILTGGKLMQLVEAIKLGRATYSTIKQNLFWALAYNVVAIPIAAMGMLSPMIGALSMAFSDVVVIGNSLRLRLRK